MPPLPPLPTLSRREWKALPQTLKNYLRSLKRLAKPQRTPRAKRTRKLKIFGPAVYATHQPLLVKYLWETARQPRPYIVEHGCGDYSSPIIRQFCDAMNLNRVTVEADAAWAKQWCDATNFASVDQFAAWVKADDRAAKIGLAFIDGNQYERQRMIDLCSQATFLVVHDTEKPWLYNYDFSRFTVLESSSLIPRTSVLRSKPENAPAP